MGRVAKNVTQVCVALLQHIFILVEVQRSNPNNYSRISKKKDLLKSACFKVITFILIFKTDIIIQKYIVMYVQILETKIKT